MADLAPRRASEARRVMLQAWSDDLLGTAYALDLLRADPRGVGARELELVPVLRRAVAESLAQATIYVVDHTITDLTQAMWTLPGMRLSASPAFRSDGWVWFPVPATGRNREGGEVPIRALSWAWLSAEHPLAESHAGLCPVPRRATGPMAGALVSAYSDTEALTSAGRIRWGAGRTVHAPGTPQLAPVALLLWCEGATIDEVHGWGRQVERVDRAQVDTDFCKRVAASLWALGRLRLTEVDLVAPGGRLDRRRAVEAGVRDPDAPVHILRPKPGFGGVPG